MGSYYLVLYHQFVVYVARGWDTLMPYPEVRLSV